MTLVKLVRKILFTTCNRGKRLGFTPNTAKAAGDLWPMSRMGGQSVDGKFLREDIKGSRSLAKLT